MGKEAWFFFHPIWYVDVLADSNVNGKSCYVLSPSPSSRSIAPICWLLYSTFCFFFFATRLCVYFPLVDIYHDEGSFFSTTSLSFSPFYLDFVRCSQLCYFSSCFHFSLFLVHSSLLLNIMGGIPILWLYCIFAIHEYREFQHFMTDMRVGSAM